jgi:hypothetical protein
MLVNLSKLYVALRVWRAPNIGVAMISNVRIATYRVRPWGTGAGVTVGALVAAALIGVANAPGARADTPEDVLDQAIQDLMQGTSVLDAAPTASLSAQQASLLADQEMLGTQLDPLLTQIGSAEAGLSAADQTFLADADQQFVVAAQGVLSADQGFVAADQAGNLSGSGFLPADLTVVEADLGLLYADFDVFGAGIAAAFDPDIGATSAASAPTTADTAGVLTQAAASTTSAGTADELLSQAGTDLAQANEVLDSVPTTSLDTNEVSALDAQEVLQTGPASQLLATFESAQDGLLAADQTSPLLVDADQALLTDYQGLLTADEGFLAAVQSGAPLSLASELPTIQADLGLIGGDLQVGFADLVAAFDPSLLTAF